MPNSLAKDFIENAFVLAEKRAIPYLLVDTAAKDLLNLIATLRSSQQIMWLNAEGTLSEKKARCDLVVPSVSYELDSVSRVKIGVFLGFVQGFFKYNESIACLTSQCPSNDIDTLLVVSPKKFFPWLGKREETFRALLKKISPLTFICLLQVALRLMKEGKEGKRLGTLFVLGDPKTLEPYTKQLILNPMKGHLQKIRNIRNPEFFETIRELASVDGGFVVSPQGTVLSGGTYFLSSSQRTHLKKGLGARHAAAAFITKQVECLAIVISESAANLSVFYAGKPILESS